MRRGCPTSSCSGQSFLLAAALNRQVSGCLGSADPTQGGVCAEDWKDIFIGVKIHCLEQTPKNLPSGERIRTAEMA